MIGPGQIVTLKDIKKTDLGGYLWCVSSEVGDVRSCRKLKDYEVAQLRSVLQQKGKIEVVVVGSSLTGGGNRALFALEQEFEKELIDYFYEKKPNGKFTGKARLDEPEILDLWVERWADGAANFRSVRCQDTFSPHLLSPESFVEWKTVIGKHWRMPVFAEKQCCWLNGPYRYCPSEQYIYGFSCPSATHASAQFPVLVHVSLCNKANKKKEAKFVLHGFLRPGLCHFKFRIHVACASSISDKYANRFQAGAEERTWWEYHLKTTIPPKKLFYDSGCKDHLNGRRCVDCDELTFKKVQGEISECLAEYSSFAVTAFRESQTKELRIKKYLDKIDRWRVSITCRDTRKSIDGFCPNLGIEGVSFDWSSDRPTVHCFFQSIYMKKINSPLMSNDFFRNPFWGNNYRIWSLTDVS